MNGRFQVRESNGKYRVCFWRQFDGRCLPTAEVSAQRFPDLPLVNVEIGGRLPLGKVETVSDDGTVTIRLDENSPDAQRLLRAYFDGGTDEANRVLKELQSSRANDQ